MRDWRIGVVGCGLIGVSWAALFQSYGYKVAAWDPSSSVREQFPHRVAGVLNSMRDLGLQVVADAPRIVSLETIDEVAETCRFIQENAPERLELKRELFNRIASVDAPQRIVASSTSSLTWPEMFEGISGNVMWLTAHPFNPPHLVPLVEIFSPDSHAAETASTFYRSVGKFPVRLKKPAVGHIANRLASALWREAVDLVAQDVADPEDIDAALVQGPGVRWAIMGAHMAYHLGGGSGGIRDYLNHLGPSQERRWSTLGQPRLTPDICERIAVGVDREAGNNSILALEAVRDQSIVSILKARRTIPE